VSAQPLVELHAVTRVEQLEGVARARFAVARSGGWISGHQQFSNVSLCLWFEVDGGRLPELGEAFRKAGIPLTREPDAVAGDVRCSLQITFVHSEPDLRTPPIPG
jgi:hypothetical protein